MLWCPLHIPQNSPSQYPKAASALTSYSVGFDFWFGLVGFNIFYHPPCIAILARRRLSTDIKHFHANARSASDSLPHANEDYKSLRGMFKS
jgi:hypothetical protein